MTDIGLDRSDGQRNRPALSKRVPDRGSLDRVARRCARAVHLEKCEIVRGNPGGIVYRPQQRRLRRFARERETDGATVGVDRGSPYHRVDPIFRGDRVRERFQDYNCAALAANVAVCPLVEGKAAAAPGEHGSAREPDKGIWREQKVDPADDGGGDPFVANRLASMVKGDERRRARRVDGEARPAQVENVGYSVCQDAQGAPGHEIGIGTRRVSYSQIGIIGGRGANIDTRSAARHLAGRNAGVFECVPRELQQEPLLRIHLRGFARRYPEEGRLEQVDARD